MEGMQRNILPALRVSSVSRWQFLPGFPYA